MAFKRQRLHVGLDVLGIAQELELGASFLLAAASAQDVGNEAIAVGFESAANSVERRPDMGITRSQRSARCENRHPGIDVGDGACHGFWCRKQHGFAGLFHFGIGNDIKTSKRRTRSRSLHGQFNGASVDYLLFAIPSTPPEHAADQHQTHADDRNRHRLADIWKHEAANNHDATADDQKRGYDNCQNRWCKVDWHCNPIVAHEATHLSRRSALCQPERKKRARR